MKNKINFFILPLLVISLAFIWSRGGIQTVYLDTDLARDLSELSNIWLGKTVWLGPWLSLGFNTSPVYYYFFYPFLLLGGNAQAIFFGNIFFAAAALGWFGLLSVSKWNKKALIAVALIGISAWWQLISFHPGNGFTYVIWVFLSLTGIFFEIPFFWSSLFLGTALSFHPASVVILPILIYEWLRRKHTMSNLLYIAAGLIFPWMPIIFFEFITKGFLTRQFLLNNTLGLNLDFSFDSLQKVASISGVNLYIFVPLFLFVLFVSKNRMKIWLILLSFSLILLSLSEQLSHYLFGIVCLIWFVFIVVLLQNRFGTVILLIGCLFFAVSTLTHPPLPASRTIPQIESVVTGLSKTGILNNQQKVAVVAALPTGTGVPQADDYRFFLRLKGYQILDVSQYSQAEILVMFIEQPRFNWQNWSTWETEQFGKRILLNSFKFKDIEVIVFQK